MGEFAFERAAQVVDFFVVDEQIAVARHAELVAAEHFHAARTACDTNCCTMPVESKTKCVCRPLDCGQRNDARQRARRLHDREPRIAAECILARQAHDEVQALVLDARKRPRRIEAQRRQHRLDFPLEVVLEPSRCFARPRSCACDEFDALCAQRRKQHFVQQAILSVDEAAARARESPAAVR